MKTLLTICFFFVFNNLFSQGMQATIKKGSTPRTVDIYLKPSSSFSQKDEAMTLSLTFPATVLPAPSLGPSGTTTNSTGPVSGIVGLVPNFLVDNLASTQREVYISKEKVNGEDYYVYAFIFANTASANHDWVAGEEQLIFSIQFNGCVSNCDVSNIMLVNLPNGGSEGRAYWYFQPNTLGDITNYQNPYYQNEQTGAPVNGESNDGSALSVVTLTPSVSLPVVLKSFNVNSQDCSARLDWVSNVERDFSYYAIERSEDGVHFFEITKIQPKVVEGMEKEYSFVDVNPVSKTIFYRLRMVDKDGQSNYSNTLSLKLDCLKQSPVSIFPTISKGVFNYRLLPGLEKSEITVFNSSGQVVYKYLPAALSGVINLVNLSSGIYLARVIHNNNLIESRKIIIAR